MIHRLFILFWKDLLMRRNHYIATVLEVILPVGLIIIVNLCLPKYENEIENNSMTFKGFKDKECIARHSHYGNIIYEPSTPFTDILMSKAACYAGYKKSNVKPGLLRDNSSYFSIGVKFENVSANSSSIPSVLNYTLFPTNKAFIHLHKMWRYFGSTIPRYNIPTLYSVVELQTGIDMSFLHFKNISSSKLILKNMDFFGRNPRLFFVAIFGSLILAFTLMVPPIVSRVVQEKYTGAKELMLMMGIVKWQLWVAKFMDIFLIMIITVSTMVVFLCVPLREDSNYLRIPPLMLWSVLLYGLIGVIFFLFFMSCFFEKSTVAVYVTEIIWFLSSVLYNTMSNFYEFPVFVKYSMCLLPHVCLMEGVSELLSFDFYGKGVKLTERLSGREDSLSLLSVLFMMTLNIFLYPTLTWYLEQVKPGKYGVPQPYNFCFKKAYWIPSNVKTCTSGSINKTHDNFEPVPQDIRVGVSLQGVSKVYKSMDKGTVTAVDDVCLDFYHSEISALLGHNGAGKTTVFSMITGLSYPTSGKVIINGFDLGVNIFQARRSLGLCPQKDMLFDDLTALQILKFYGVVKGLSLKVATYEALDLIGKLKLTNVKNTQASKLSGGQKRKVSLAIALIGGSEVLVLDEPTSGMDPEIRREIWEILLGFRGTRTILLTTHFMEEADALCDRIAIMDHGKIKCYGSPIFLKSRYGKGYVLNVVIPDAGKSKEIVDCIKHFIPVAKFKSQNIRTLSFELPENEVSVFPALLSELEEKQTKNEITSYCINLSTLEDIFLRLRSAHEAKDDFDIIDSPYKKLDIIEDLSTGKNSRFFLYFNQFWALIVKKWIFFRRSYKSFLMYCILPSLLVIYTIASDNQDHSDQLTNGISQRSLTYSLDLYPSSLVLYSDHNDAFEKDLFRDVVQSYGSDVQEVKDVKDAVYKIFEDDFYTYSKKVILAVDLSSEYFQILHNDDAVHMVPVSLNLIHNLLLKNWYKNNSIVTSINVSYANKDLFFLSRPTPECKLQSLPSYSGAQTMFYLLGPIKERLSGAKGIQLMIAPASMYWFSHLLFDVFSFFVYMVVIYLGAGFSQSEEIMFQNAGIVLMGFLLWGSALILLTYVISTVIRDVAAGFSVNIITYTVFTFFIFYGIIWDGLPKCLQYLHPACILKLGFVDLCSGKESNFMLALFLYNSGVFAFLVLRDSKLLGQLVHRLVNRFVRVDYSIQRTTQVAIRANTRHWIGKEEKDVVVKEEEDEVQKLIDNENFLTSALIVAELKRWYSQRFRPFPAVRGISFAVRKGECFGLLGVNGAGKSSTFKILTGAIPASHGCAYACSEQLSFFNRQKYLFSIGYCPQFGGYIPDFTGRELLTFFALLRGVHRSCVREVIEKLLEKMNLLEYANQKSGTYSGGNQRKLSTAIALIGDCPLVFLDEPTTGVDPLSRRSIWNVIGDIQKEGQSVLLTSHSMDECEALCSRLAIMVEGRFRCIGETTTLKERFGQGYCVQLKMSNGAAEEMVHSLKKSMEMTFKPDCKLMDEHLTVLQYHVMNKSVSWADLFTRLNELKESFIILESYTASSTTLEQIFIYFARSSGEEV